MDLCCDRNDCPVFERFRGGRPVIRKSAVAESIGSDAVGAAVCGGATRRIGDFRCSDDFRSKTVPSRSSTRLTFGKDSTCVGEIPSHR